MYIPEAPKISINQYGETVCEIGISGTRIGGSPLQIDIMRGILRGKTGKLHHGDCVGWDKEVHDLIRKEFHDKWRIIIHPPLKNEMRAFCLGDEVLEPWPYMMRNKDIVNKSNVFLAAPKDEKVYGGTWKTITYFQEVISEEFGKKRNPRSGTLVLPNGDIGHILVDSERKARLFNGN